jgi:hypothetical protein
MFARIFMLRNDKNGDGKVDNSELVGAETGFQRLHKNSNGFSEADELGELHQSRMNDPKRMRERLESEDVRKPPKGKQNASATQLVIGPLPRASSGGSGIQGLHIDRHGRMQWGDVQ